MKSGKGRTQPYCPSDILTRRFDGYGIPLETLGVMNVAAMVFLTLLIFAEKSLPWGSSIANVAGVALVTYGAAVLVTAHGLPGIV